MMLWIAETLVATTVLMLLILAIRPFVASHLGARAAYLLWLAPALRMILPPLPADWFGAHGAAVEDVVVVLAGTSSPALQPAATTGGGTAWLIASLTIWLGGAVFFFARHWLAYLRFARNVGADGRPLFDAGRIPVTASAAVSSPIALGVFGRSVIVPTDFEHRYDADEQRLAVAHELTHHDRHDVPANFAALAVLALHWWNPVAHIAHRAFRLDQEAACDAIVLQDATPDERHAYGSALFKSAMGSVPLAACAMGATVTLKARLRRIVSGHADRRLARPGKALAAFLVLGGVAATASGTVATGVAPGLELPASLSNRPGLVLASTTLSATGHDEANCPDARKHARERAEKALRAAEMARGRALAEAHEAVAAAHAEEAATHADIQSALEDARAESRAALAEARAEIDAAMAEMRAAGAEAEDAVDDAADKIAAPRPNSHGCAGKASDGLAGVDTVIAANGRKQLRVTVCGAERMSRAHVAEALRSARAEIAGDASMPAGVRDRIVAALDRQIGSIRTDETPTLQ